MLTPEERAKITAGLQALMVRGRISGKAIPVKQEEIAEIMRPLPPPWEWERLRLLTGMPASVMGRRTGVHDMRIRHWEKGGGTQHPESWTDYGEALTRVLGEDMGAEGAGSAIGLAGGEADNESVRALVEQQRVTANSLSVWLKQDVQCSASDLSALWEAVRTAKLMTRAFEKKLRERMRIAADVAGGTGREGQNATTGA